MRTEEEVKDEIRRIIIEEIQATNLITQDTSPDKYLPRFINNLTTRLFTLTLDEILYRRRF